MMNIRETAYLVENDITRGLDHEAELRMRVEAMAERTGDPELDALIEQYLARNEFDWWENAFEGNKFMGDTWTREQLEQNQVEENGAYGPGDLSKMRDPGVAEGQCGSLARDFQRFMQARGIKVELLSDNPENLYHDVGENTGGHAVTLVHFHGQIYSVDWTAAQYQYKEFPMVQRLNDGGWQREWTDDNAST